MNNEQDMERKHRVYDLRLKGMTYRQIAKLEGISVGTAHRWVKEVLDNITLPMVEEIRKQEVDRLMRYLERLDERIDDGDDKAISIALKISERLCKMLGADMPQQINVERTEVTQVDLALRDLIDSQKARNEARKAEAATLRVMEADILSPDEDSGEDGIERIVLEN